MKLYIASAIAWWAAVATQTTAEPEWLWSPTDAPAPPPETKVIQLDHDIVPTWDQLGTTARTTKIRLWRLYSYWSALEARDKKAIKSLYSKWSEDAAASAKVDDFYDGAKKCLRKQQETVRKTRSEIDTALAEIKSCMAENVVPPQFTVLESQGLPSEYYSPVVVDYGDADKEADDEEIVVITHTPTVTPAPVIAYEEPGTTSDTEPIAGGYGGPVTGGYTSPIESTHEEGEPVPGGYTMGHADMFPTNAPETGASAESLTVPEVTKAPVDSTAGFKGDVETPNPTFTGDENAPEPIQPEPVEPVVIAAPPQPNAEPVEAGAGVEGVAPATETVQPEPVRPVEIWTTKPEFEEPTDPPGTDPSTTEPPLADTGATLAPGDEPYISKELNPPEKPEPFQHVLPPVTPTDSPVILSESDAPEKPAPFEHNEPVVGSTTNGPVIISEIDPPELDPAHEATSIVQPHVEVKYENADGETTAPQDYDHRGEVTYAVATQGPTIEYETTTPETTEPPPVDVVYSDPEGVTTAPEVFHVSDGEANAKDAMAPTPTEAETIVPLSPPVEITEPPQDVRPEVVAPDPSTWPFSPVSPAVPPLWALDMDRSDTIDFHEWQAYLKKLHGLASATVKTGRDREAVLLLQAIVNFHYGALGQCILRKLKQENAYELDPATYPAVAKWIEDHCYVKFRYSLLAGPPPFEWVAKDQPTVTPQEIEAWFAKHAAKARKDLGNGSIVIKSRRHQEMLERIVACNHKELDAKGTEPINRDAFYVALRKIDDCAGL